VRIKILVLLSAVALTVLLTSCATSRGSTLETVTAAESPSTKGATHEETPPPPPPENAKGLQVLTNPDKAEVWIDGTLVGLSPYTDEDIQPGWHRIVIRKAGYYESAAWVRFDGPPVVYRADLELIVGFLQLSVTPDDSIVTVGGRQLPQGLLTLPVGTYTVLVRAFGYQEQQRSVVVAEKAVTTLSVELSTAPFTVTSFRLPKPRVNPENPGVLGSLEYDVSVSGPGAASVQVTDGAGREVYARSLPGFTTWDNSYTWELRDTAGALLPDGTYTMKLSASGKDTDAVVENRATFVVDRSLRIAVRSVWSGSSGLLYAPVAEVLPQGDFQAGLLGAGVSASDSVFRAPVILGARFGMPGDLEADASAGLILGSSTTPLTAGLAARWSLVSARGAYGTGMAIQAKLAVQVNPTTGYVLMTDTLANFTGLSVEVPFQLRLDKLNLVLSAGAAGSFWYPYRWDTTALPQLVPLFGAVGWLYLRGGVLIDLGDVMFGISASTRTEPLPGGISLLSSPIPFEAGAEIHWLIPGTRLLLSAIAAGEYQDSSNYYIMGGAGLGYLY
jgi:hypothetical protein